MRKTFIHAIVYLCTLLCLHPLYAEDESTMNSLQITEASIKGVPNCMHYKITGICFWLECSVFGCDIETTFKVDHYLPDLVASVYTTPQNNPFWFAKTVLDPAFYEAGKIQIKQTTHFDLGSGHEHNNSQRDINNRFHEVDLIGNPALTLLSGYGLFLQSAAIPFNPYYSSLLDAYAWRYPALERFYPGSLIPGLHDVGEVLLHDWGPVYPRNGYVNQPDDAKAAAVNALRAALIVTKSDQPHVYQPLSDDCGDHCSIEPVKENNKNAQFQMIYPKLETTCTVFGQSDLGQLRPWQTDAATQGHNRYIWLLWRHYHGCIPDPDGKYLGSINF